MMEEDDKDIGRTVGFQVDDFIYIATIIKINDHTEQFTVRTEDGQELVGPFDAVFLNPEKRMDELHENYEPLGDGKFRAKHPELKSNWTPVPDPSLRSIAQTAGTIIGVALAIALLIIIVSFGDILTQIGSEDWVETEGSVVDAYDGQDCSTDSDGGTSCTSYTSVTVEYTYEGRKYSTKDYSMLSNNWLNDAQHWLGQDSVTVYVNPEQPSQAVHLQGWDGVSEEVFTLLFFTGLILFGYLFLAVPVWFVYAKIQRLTGIEAPGEKEEEGPDSNDLKADGDSKNDGKPVTDEHNIAEARLPEAADASLGGEQNSEEEKFW
jgi:hypothetical protein